MVDKKAVTGEQFYTPPPKLGNWEGFKVFLWNSETSQFLGRTGSSWAKILLFYLIFYAALIGFFAAIFAVFYQTLDDHKPKWQLDNGLIGSNPGLGFRPMPPDANVESTLIWYNHNIPENFKHWTKGIDSFLKTYEPKAESKDNAVECGTGKKAPDGKFCNVSLSSFSNCVSSQNYNYHLGLPCIFLKLNKIFNWEPELYTPDDLPSNMPKDLVNYIKGEKNVRPSADNDIVWVTCAGENPSDRENIRSVNYHPLRGFPAYYFPFKNVKGYLPPLVAVQFNVTQGVLINIECKAWAKNIHHDRADRRGSVHFELMID